MRRYFNELSLRGQFEDGAEFESVLREIIAARARLESLRRSFYTTRLVADRQVTAVHSVREIILRSEDRDLRGAIFAWLDKYGPFIDEDRQAEDDDYFECAGEDVTEAGLGEAARRVRHGERSSVLSIPGGPAQFNQTPISVDHGLPEERYGTYQISNFLEVANLVRDAIADGPEITDWRMLIEAARTRFPSLCLPDSLYGDHRLSRDPFDPVIRDRALGLLGILNAYMEGRDSDGKESEAAREVIQAYFTGERALFTGESKSNQEKFLSDLTFKDPKDVNKTIFAHWHGKISRKFYRLHFEWPVPPEAAQLKVLYLGPKLTKS